MSSTPRRHRRKPAQFMMPDGTLMIPLFILFLTSLNGITIEAALNESWSAFTQAPHALVLWSLVVVLNIALYGYALPIFKVWMHRLLGRPVSEGQVDMAMRHLNHLTSATLFWSVATFVAAQVAFEALNPPDFSARAWMTSMTLDFGQAAGNGFLVGVLLSLQFDNRLYRAREAVVAAGPRVKLAYHSVYSKVFLLLAATVVFLCFQIFASSGAFFSLGHGEMVPNSATGKHSWMSAPELILQSGSQSELKDTLDVFGLRVLLMLLVVAYLLFQLRGLFRNPLNTVQVKLAVLNSPEAGQVKQIDIVQNDEFAAVYREINALIARQQDRLDLTSKRLQDIIGSAADPILSYDAQGRIRLVNDAARRVFERPGQPLLGSELDRLIDGGAATLRAAHDGDSHRLTWTRADGQQVLLESSFSDGSDADDFWTTVILRDVTLQAQLEATLTRARTEAEHANRMKSEFLANMSHELRTPLNAILGFTQLLEHDKNLTGAQVERIRVISRSGEHLLGLINDILDISKIEAGKMELHPGVFDLHQFVDDLRELFALKCRSKGLTLYVETLEGVPRYVVGDLGKLRQILINLVGNAVKFTAEGGISILTGMDGNRVRFAVKDTGRGIPADEQQKILQPFVQASTTDNEGGTGLGLAISSRYVEMMGGTFSVESEPDVGSTFSFSVDLPESGQHPAEASGDEVAIAIKPGHDVTVLVVDDQLANRLVLKEMLEQAGFTVLEAVNGQQAVERAREFRPPLIFMDIKMPVLDGYGAVEQLKADASTQDLRVFALTASAFSHDEVRIRSSGFDGFLAKPFKQTALYRLIRDKGGVQLEYETATTVGSAAVEPPGPQDFAEARGALTPEDRHGLDDAALINDFGTVAGLAERYHDRQPRFFAALKRAADGYDESAISTLLGGLS